MIFHQKIRKAASKCPHKKSVDEEIVTEKKENVDWFPPREFPDNKETSFGKQEVVSRVLPENNPDYQELLSEENGNFKFIPPNLSDVP